MEELTLFFRYCNGESEWPWEAGTLHHETKPMSSTFLGRLLFTPTCTDGTNPQRELFLLMFYNAQGGDWLWSWLTSAYNALQSNTDVGVTLNHCANLICTNTAIPLTAWTKALVEIRDEPLHATTRLGSEESVILQDRTPTFDECRAYATLIGLRICVDFYANATMTMLDACTNALHDESNDWSTWEQYFKAFTKMTMYQPLLQTYREINSILCNQYQAACIQTQFCVPNFMQYLVALLGGIAQFSLVLRCTYGICQHSCDTQIPPPRYGLPEDEDGLVPFTTCTAWLYNDGHGDLLRRYFAGELINQEPLQRYIICATWFCECCYDNTVARRSLGPAEDAVCQFSERYWPSLEDLLQHFVAGHGLVCQPALSDIQQPIFVHAILYLVNILSTNNALSSVPVSVIDSALNIVCDVPESAEKHEIEQQLNAKQNLLVLLLQTPGYEMRFDIAEDFVACLQNNPTITSLDHPFQHHPIARITISLVLVALDSYDEQPPFMQTMIAEANQYLHDIQPQDLSPENGVIQQTVDVITNANLFVPCPWPKYSIDHLMSQAVHKYDEKPLTMAQEQLLINMIAAPTVYTATDPAVLRLVAQFRANRPRWVNLSTLQRNVRVAGTDPFHRQPCTQAQVLTLYLSHHTRIMTRDNGMTPMSPLYTAQPTFQAPPFAPPSTHYTPLHPKASMAASE